MTIQVSVALVSTLCHVDKREGRTCKPEPRTQSSYSRQREAREEGGAKRLARTPPLGPMLTTPVEQTVTDLQPGVSVAKRGEVISCEFAMCRRYQPARYSEKAQVPCDQDRRKNGARGRVLLRRSLEAIAGPFPIAGDAQTFFPREPLGDTVL